MENKGSLKKVLVAIRPMDLPLLSTALGSEFDLVICHTLEVAKMHLDQNIGLIACGVRFDGGQMFELLYACKVNPYTQSTPFYLVLGDSKGYSKPILDGIETAAKALGANGFTDLSRLEDDLGKAKAYERLRKAIRQFLEL